MQTASVSKCIFYSLTLWCTVFVAICFSSFGTHLILHNILCGGLRNDGFTNNSLSVVGLCSPTQSITTDCDLQFSKKSWCSFFFFGVGKGCWPMQMYAPVYKTRNEIDCPFYRLFHKKVVTNMKLYDMRLKFSYIELLPRE